MHGQSRAIERTEGVRGIFSADRSSLRYPPGFPLDLDSYLVTAHSADQLRFFLLFLWLICTTFVLLAIGFVLVPAWWIWVGRIPVNSGASFGCWSGSFAHPNCAHLRSMPMHPKSGVCFVVICFESSRVVKMQHHYVWGPFV